MNKLALQALLLLSSALGSSITLAAQTPATSGDELPANGKWEWWEDPSSTGTAVSFTTGAGGDAYFGSVSLQKDLIAPGEAYRVSSGDEAGVGFVHVYVFHISGDKGYTWKKYRVQLIGSPANKLSNNAAQWTEVAHGTLCPTT